MKKIVTLLAFCFAVVFAQAQTFQKVFNGLYNPTDAYSCSDGSILFGGFGWDIVKTDAVGNVIWAKTISGNDFVLLEVGETGTGNYFAFGYDGIQEVTLVVLDVSGNILWVKSYYDPSGGGYYHRPRAKSLGDGGFIMTLSYNEGLFVITTDASGNILWGNNYMCDANPTKNPSLDVIETADGGFLISGKAESDNYFVKTDAGGNVQWAKRFQDLNYYNWPEAIVQASDGSYYAAGYEFRGALTQTAFLMKMDANGNMLWYKSFSGATATYTLRDFGDVKQLPNGNLVMSSGYYTAGSVIVMTDTNGNVLSSKKVPYSSAQAHCDLTSSGDILFTSLDYTAFAKLFRLSGTNFNDWCGMEDLPLVIDSTSYNPIVLTDVFVSPIGISYSESYTTTPSTVTTADYCLTLGITEADNATVISISPNPSNGLFTVAGFGEMKGGVIEIYNVLGEKTTPSLILAQGGGNSFTLDLSDEPKGIYFVRLTADGKTASAKVVIE